MAYLQRRCSPWRTAAKLCQSPYKERRLKKDSRNQQDRKNRMWTDSEASTSRMGSSTSWLITDHREESNDVEGDENTEEDRRVDKEGVEGREMPANSQSGPGSYWVTMCWVMLEVFIAETVGTAMLMFFGCMGQVRWDPHNDLPPMQAAIVFSVVVATIIQIFGHISAAHLNPAVTIAFTLLGQVTPSMALVYILSEGAGALLGYGLLMVLTPEDMLSLSTPPGLCSTVPHQGLTNIQALAMEFLATCFLVLVVCACSDTRNSQNTDSTPLKFAATIMALSVTVGPYTGASMNPVRSLAPAFWNGTWSGHWIYWLGPCLAGVTATVFYQTIFNRPVVDDMAPLEDAPLSRIKVVESQRTDLKRPS